MAFSTTIYNAVFRRNSVYVSTIFVGAFGFAVGYDKAVTAVWDRWNAGKQWKDIRHKYVTEGGSEDDE
ncbi:ubiquinol-cytochrome C reductase [Pterulicium gracile]|uniref:Complex III subunit 9 n=1 Tax=Pterulicium gracile TaxID=1884261 RepID=A0A5C3QW86_9AGAR|nr:ubiquinol-cytochrome C reductase [Pterula gracilis]